MRTTTTIALLLGCWSWVTVIVAQPDTTRILFLGNSYTAYNNLPNLVRQLAASHNQVALVDQNVPGGYTLSSHQTNATSLQKIRQGNWDVVVLQEQSQIPTIPFYRDGLFFPGAAQLTDSIRAYQPCARVVYYLTWGRQNGGQQCDQNGTHCSPVFVDFGHMQDSLTAAYRRAMQQTAAQIAPVGEAWRHAMQQGGPVLHAADQSHPNLSGSYLAACVLYATVWQQPTVGSSYTAGLATSTAGLLQASADSIALGQASHWDARTPLQADFSAQPTGTQTFGFDNSASLPQGGTYHWIFTSSQSPNSTIALYTDFSTQWEPNHTFRGYPPYIAMLILDYCGQSDTLTRNMSYFLNTPMPSNIISIQIYPNPAAQQLVVHGARLGSKVVIYNQLGQKVYQQVLSTDSTVVLPDWPAGSYTLVLLSEKGQPYWSGQFKKLATP